MNKYYVNNKYVDSEQAFVSIKDLGFLRGYGVFDLARAKGLNIHKFDQHFDRFEGSSKYLNLNIPYKRAEIRSICRELLKINNFNRSLVRLILTGGVSPDNHNVEKETFIVMADEFIPFPDKYYKNGINVVTKEFMREIPKAKTLNYQFAFTEYQNYSREEAFEIVYYKNNIVSEASTSNVFVIKNDTIYTPKDDILLGVTRQEVIDLALKNGFAVRQQPLTTNQLLNADEVFITATTKGIMPVVAIDKKKIGTGSPGPITNKLMLKLHIM